MMVRPISHEVEYGKWLAILTLAAVLTMMFATALGATDQTSRTGKLPMLTREDPRFEPALPGTGSFGLLASAATDVWRVLELHEIRRHKEAIEGWEEMELPAELQSWKHIAIGQALMALSRFEESERHLSRAIQLEADNGVAHYFLGVLRLQQSYLAEEWPDVVGVTNIRLVGSHGPSGAGRGFAPNSKSLYELAAIRAFERAIELESQVPMERAIVPLDGAVSLIAPPTVGDLTASLGGELFAAKAHNSLSYLFLDRGALEIAEHHMDEAVRRGMTAVYGFRDLGDEYRQQQRHIDAARAYFKSAQHAANKLQDLRNAWRCILRATVEP